jgi:hypothetical protein
VDSGLRIEIRTRPCVILPVVARVFGSAWSDAKTFARMGRDLREPWPRWKLGIAAALIVALAGVCGFILSFFTPSIFAHIALFVVLIVPYLRFLAATADLAAARRRG